MSATTTRRPTVLVVECSLPEGLTLPEYRRSRPPRPTLGARIRRLFAS